MTDLAGPRDRISLLVALTATVGASIVLWLFLVVAQPWAVGARPATCLSTRCFCEAERSGPIAQPANTWSSLAYVALGAWAVVRFVRGSGRNRAGSSGLLIPAAALVMCVIGLTSAFYHATLTFLGQYLDVMSMYLLGALLICGALWRRGSLGEGAALMAFVAMVVALGVAQYVDPELRRVLFAVVLVPGIALELTTRVHGVSPPDRRLAALRGGIALMALGYAFWLLDQFDVLCWPESLFQGHAAWHTLTAAAAGLLVLHYAGTPRPSARGVRRTSSL